MFGLMPVVAAACAEGFPGEWLGVQVDRLNTVACKTLPALGCSMRTTKVQGRTSKSFDEVFGNLIAQGMSTDQLHNAVCKQVSSPYRLYAPC